MNILTFDRQVAVIAALTEGCSIRSTERLTCIHRDTIMRLAARVGFGAIKFHDRTVHSLQVPRLELDEAWSFVGKKQRRCTPADGITKGDQYVFLGMSASSKAIISFQVGKRNEENTKSFVWDLRERIINAPEISTDGLGSYEAAIEEAFGANCRYGQVVKRTKVTQESALFTRSCSSGKPALGHRRSASNLDKIHRKTKFIGARGESPVHAIGEWF
jgi:hypothetical protein